MTNNTGVEVTQDYYGYPVETVPALVSAKDLPLAVKMAGAEAITLDHMKARANYDAACDCWDAMVKALSPIANEIEFNGFNEDVAAKVIPGPIAFQDLYQEVRDLITETRSRLSKCEGWRPEMAAILNQAGRELEFFAESANKSPDPAEGLAADLSDAVVQDILYAKDVAEARKRIGFALAALANTEAAVAEAVERAAKIAECAYDDRPRSRFGHPRQPCWGDGYREGTRAAAAAIRTTDGGET